MAAGADSIKPPKNMKKTLSVSCILLALTVLFAALGAVAASAQLPEFTKESVTAYVFELDQTREFECLFLDDLPDVPYLQPVDYLNVIYLDPFTVESNGSGVYTVTNAYSATMVVDAENDTVYFEDYDQFTNCEINEEGTSLEINYVKVNDGYVVAAAEPVTLDLAAYNIDIIEDEGKVYLPLSILAAMFASTYNNALYLDGDICFVRTFDPECYYYGMDLSFLYQETERTEEMAAFSYNSLCFSIDYFFGKPSSTLLAEMLRDHTLDQSLAEFNEETAAARELLQSTSLVDYMNGFMVLGYYLFDGGHTVLTSVPISSYEDYSDSPLMTAWLEEMDKPGPISDMVKDSYNAIFTSSMLNKIVETRKAEYKKYEDEIAAEWESGAFLILHEDAAVFVFDSFELTTPNEFKEALDIAEEAGVTVFILDDSCNGGGYVVACNYILSVISNSMFDNPIVTVYTEDPLTEKVVGVNYSFDLNLDGVFDAEDQNVKYDFEFAVLTSQGAFSCGNALPVGCAELGILVMGEPSGGGSCIVSERYTVEGYAFPISEIQKWVSPSGIDYDLGAPVENEYYLSKLDENTNWDFTGFYDFDYLIRLTKHYYEGTPVVLEGFKTEWSTDNGGDLTFVSSADINDFECVRIDGNVLDPANYSVEAGSTIVTLKSGYLWSLPRGEHTITIVSSTGEAEAPFTVDNILTNPITGDDGQFVLWVAMIALSVCVIGTVLISCRTKKTSV